MRQTLLLASALLASQCLAAQTTADDNSTLNLGEIIITTATRSESTLDDALANVRVVTRDDILRSGATDSIELLRYVAGIDIARTGGTGQQTSIFTRGTESNHTLVLIDGVRMNPATIGVPAIQNIAPEQIERIEIVTGPRSSLYGSDAIGGVINIITAGENIERSVSVGAGTHNLERAGAHWGISSGDTVFRLSADRLRTGSIPTRSADDNDRGFENQNYRLSLTTPLADGLLTLSHWQADGDSEYSDFFLNPVSQSFENRASTLGWQGTFNERWQSNVAIGLLKDEIAQQESADFLTSDRLTIDWQNTLTVDDSHQIVAGIYYADEAAESLSFGLGVDEEVSIKALYLQDQYRQERWQTLVSLRLTDHDAFGRELTWNLGGGFDVTDRLTLQANAGRAFRAPDATDRFGFGGNPDLDAETAQQFELRAIYRLDNGWRLSLEAWRNEIENLIEFDFVTFTLVNIDEATIEGVTADARWVNELWQVELTANYQDPRNDTTGNRLLRRARASASARVSRRFGDHSVDLSVRTNDARRDFGGTRLAGYGLASIAGRFMLSENLSLTARVDNLTDTRYETAAGFNQLGRTTTLQVRYDW